MNAQQISDKARSLTAAIGNYPATLEYRPLIERMIADALTEAAKPLDLEFPADVARCKRCDSALMFSARRHNTGLCHPCAHQVLMDAIKESANQIDWSMLETIRQYQGIIDIVNRCRQPVVVTETTDNTSDFKQPTLLEHFINCIDDLETAVKAHAELEWGMEVVHHYRAIAQQYQ